MHNSILRILIILTTTLFLASTALATEPAVSKINGKSELLAGSVDGNDLWAISGSIALPLNNATGVQFDAAFGELEKNQDLSGFGLHLFTRDPAIGLAGIVASIAEIENIDLNRYAVEGEYYGGPITIAALLGQQSGDVDNDLFGSLDLRWYPMDDLMVEIGTSFAGNKDKIAHIGAEYQLLKSLVSYTGLALSVYTDIAVGEDSYDHALLGLRTYFGAPKELSKRHREDDPINPIINGILKSSGNISDAIPRTSGGMTQIDPPL